jgi:hypothetical protein
MSSLKPDLVFSPVLNFVFQAIKAGNKYDEVEAKAVQYFRADMLTKVKDELWQLAAMYTCSTDLVKPQDIVADKIRDIRTCDEKNVVLPMFVIDKTDEVPILSGEITATLTRQVIELHSTVDNLIDHLIFFRSAKIRLVCASH